MSRVEILVTVKLRDLNRPNGISGWEARAIQKGSTAMRIRGTLIKNAARQEIESTRNPPTTGPRIVVAPEAPAQTPNARPCSSPEKLEVIRASDPGTSRAPAAPCRT